MTPSRSPFGVTGLALGVLGFTLLHQIAAKPSAALPIPGLPTPSPPRTPSEAARHQASHEWAQSKLRAAREMERLEQWDPSLETDQWEKAWRRQWLVDDPGGAFRRARAAARRAALLARTRQELYEATLLRVWLDREAGDRRAELEQARRLMALRPDDPQSLLWLHQALSPLEPRTSVPCGGQTGMRAGWPRRTDPGGTGTAADTDPQRSNQP